MSNEWVMVPREPTANQLVDGAYEVPDPISHRGELTARMVYRAMLDAAPAAPAQQAGPVAWVDVHDRDEGPYEFHGRKLLPAGQHELFLHPPAAEVQRMREALGAILKRTLDASSYRSGQDVHDIARRALEGQ